MFLLLVNLSRKPHGKVTEIKTKQDWAIFMEEIAHKYEMAEKITIES